MMRDADRAVDAQRDAAQVERLLEHAQHPAGHDDRTVLVVVARDDDAELVAAEAGQHVVRAEHAAQARADAPQQLVAGGVAQGVVELLEVVEIEQQQRGAPPAAHDLVEVPGERAAVGQAGQLVGARLDAALAELLDLAEGQQRASHRRGDRGDGQAKPERRDGDEPRGDDDAEAQRGADGRDDDGARAAQVDLEALARVHGAKLMIAQPTTQPALIGVPVTYSPLALRKRNSTSLIEKTSSPVPSTTRGRIGARPPSTAAPAMRARTRKSASG